MTTGNEINLYFKELETDPLVAVVCGKTSVLNIATETAERTTTDSGIFKQYKALAISGSISFEGDVFLNNTWSVIDLIDWQLALTSLFFTVETLNDPGPAIVYAGKCIIESVSYTGTVDAVATFSVNLIIDGAITKL